MELLRASLDLYGSLEEETGQSVDLHRCGSVRLAATPDRLDEFQQRASTAALLDVPVEIVGPERLRELFPLVDPAGVLAAAYLPTDGHVDPTSVTQALAAGALAGGAHDRPERARHGARALERRLDAHDAKGSIRAETVVNAAGQWSRQVARLAGVELPIVPLQHHYVVTEPLPEVAALARELPVLRDPDASFYVRQEGDGLLVGPFERNPKTWALDGVPEDFHGRLLPARPRPDLGRARRGGGGASPRSPTPGSRQSSTARTATRPTAAA